MEYSSYRILYGYKVYKIFKVEKHCIAGASEARAGSPALVKYWLLISFI